MESIRALHLSQLHADTLPTSPELRRQARAAGTSWKAMIHRGADGIGAHELGHTIIEDYGIDAQTHWFNEFLASYIGYA